MIKDPQCVTTEAFRQDVKAAQLNLRNDEEDIQAIAFYCWLTSKMFNRDYYEVLLNAIGWKRDSGLGSLGGRWDTRGAVNGTTK